MIHENVELHNVCEIKQLDDYVTFSRVPEAVRLKLNEGALNRMLQPANCEIRFVAEPPDPIRVTLSSETVTDVVPFFGDFLHSKPMEVGEEPQTIELEWNPQLMENLEKIRTIPMRFDPKVVRLILWGCAVRLHKIEGTGIRPPEKHEVPSLRYLAYGTSITHGASATAPHLNYAAQTARRLGADLINLGVGGACHCEPELADHIAARDDWDVASLALSVNMMGFAEEEFEKRVRYFVKTVAGGDPRRPVACVTIYPYRGSLGDGELPTKVQTFRQILRDAVRDCPTPNAHLIEGHSLLQDFSGLTTDLIHPSDDGMIQMGENLARAMRPLIALGRRGN